MELIALVAGVGLAAWGGDRFVRGCVGTSLRLRVPETIVAATFAAFATSSPELVVAVLAAIDGRSGVALGDASGSTLVNLGVVLASSLLIVPVFVRRSELRREVVAVSVAIGSILVLSADGSISRPDGAVLLAVFLGWLVLVVRDARRWRQTDVEVLADSDPDRAVVDLVLGLVLLIAAGRLVLVGAEWVGERLGWDDFVIGAVLVAVATSIPEFVTSVIAVARSHAAVALGTILGSNVFNMAFVVGVAATIDPVGVRWIESAIPLVFGLSATLLVIPGRSGRLGRGRGVLLLVTYAASLGLLIAVR